MSEDDRYTDLTGRPWLAVLCNRCGTTIDRTGIDAHNSWHETVLQLQNRIVWLERESGKAP